MFYLSLPRATKAIKYTILSETAFTLSLACSKLSICLFLLRIFKKTTGDKGKRIFLHSTMGLLFLTTVICVSQLVGQCRPAQKLWNPTVPGSCEDPSVQVKFGYFNGGEVSLSRILSVLHVESYSADSKHKVVAAWVDFSLAAFPISFVKDLQLSMTEKIALCSLLSFGVL